MRIILFLFTTLYFFTLTHSSILGGGLDNVDPRYPSREYRRFLLPNKMKVMLISDPTLQRSAASMTVAVGSMNDSAKRYGLAHFLEHMLFLGTEKYPEGGSYQKFVSTHDGFSNAYTAEDRTNYHFEIEPEHFEEGLDRFSQFFLAPLFNPDLVEQEKRAVDSEHSKNIPNDSRRIYQVKRKAYEKDHPSRHFATGNMETLDGVNRQELISFYKKHYSSNLMMLAVAGPQDLDTLQELTVPRFANVKNNNLIESRFPAKYMSPDPRLRIMHVRTIKDTRLLKMTFPLTSTLGYYKSQPLAMLGYMIGHEGRGSLLSLLKRKNLATSLSAGGGVSNKSFSSFDIKIKLTNKGLKNYLKVIRDVFQYLRLLRKTGLPRHIYEEVKLMSEIDYKFAEKPEGISLVNIFSTLMMYYPMRTVEISPYIINEYKPRIFDSILYNLTPQNMLAIVAARSAKTSKKEQYYGVEYSLKYRQYNWMSNWRNTKLNPALRIPESNLFLPRSMEILPYKGKLKLTHQSLAGLRKEGIEENFLERLEKFKGVTWKSLEDLLESLNYKSHEEKSKIFSQLLQKHILAEPQILRDDEFGKIWFQQDYRFNTPKAKIIFRIHSPEVYASERSAVLSQLYVDAIREGLNEFSYPALLAGLDYSINVDKEGINLSFGGYSDRIQELVKSIGVRLKKIDINEKTFKTLKEDRLRRYQNFNFQQPYQQAFYYRSLLLEGKKFPIMNYEKEIKKIKLKDLKNFISKLYRKIYVEGLAYGNLRAEVVNEVTENLLKILNTESLSESKRFVKTVRQLKSGTSLSFNRKMQVENSSVLVDVQVGQLSHKLKATLMVIDSLMNPLFYNDLRTRQQMGYIVSSGMSRLEKTLGLFFVVQSGQYNVETLENKILEFIEKFINNLKEMKDTEFVDLKKSVLNSKFQKSTSVDSEASRLFNLAFKQKSNFDINSQEIEALEKLTIEDLLNVVNNSLGMSKHRKLILRMIGKKHESGNSIGNIVSSASQFKKLYPCPQNCLP